MNKQVIELFILIKFKIRICDEKLLCDVCS